jgi:hypothetical protein
VHHVEYMREISNMLFRSKEQVADRLDKLIAKIREMQSPYMNGDKPVDIVLVSLVIVPPNTPRY